MKKQTSNIITSELLKSERSWDGVKYNHYPTGNPQLSILKIKIPPYSKLQWHKHPIPNMAYIEKGKLIIEKKNRKKIIVNQGEAVAEVVNTIHRGYTESQETTIIVFYAGKRGIPLSITE